MAAKEKQFIYFISYFYTDATGHGYGNVDYNSCLNLSCKKFGMERIRMVEREMQLREKFNTLVILNFIELK